MSRSRWRGHRLADFSVKDLGEVITWLVIPTLSDWKRLAGHKHNHSHRSKSWHQPSCQNGIIAHNELYGGNAGHWFDDIKQVIFEHNVIKPGGASMTWGNNVDNYGAGFNQHIYHAKNVIEKVWAGDREMMTFDPVTGDYNGMLLSVDDDGVTLHLDSMERPSDQCKFRWSMLYSRRKGAGIFVE